MIKQFISDGTAAAFLMDALARQEPDLVAVPFSEPIYFDTVLLWKRDQYLYNDVEHFLRFAKKFKFQGIIEKHEASLRFLKFILKENKAMKKSIGKEQMFRIPYTFFISVL